MEIGICAGLGNVNEITAAGPAYIEPTVGSFLVPMESDEAFEKNLAQAQKIDLPISAINCFIPGALKSTGPDVDMDKLVQYATTVFQRANKAGIEFIVFGSGGSRNLDEGVSVDDAKSQFTDILKAFGPVAKEYDITVVVEPLNSTECNFINSLADGAELVDATAHENIQLLADVYHMLKDDESAEEISKYGILIRHCHIAERETRSAPGVAGDDFRPYLKALKEVGYAGNMSLECIWKNLESESKSGIEKLREQMADAGF